MFGIHKKDVVILTLLVLFCVQCRASTQLGPQKIIENVHLLMRDDSQFPGAITVNDMQDLDNYCGFLKTVARSYSRVFIQDDDAVKAYDSYVMEFCNQLLEAVDSGCMTLHEGITFIKETKDRATRNVRKILPQWMWHVNNCKEDGVPMISAEWIALTNLRPDIMAKIGAKYHQPEKIERFSEEDQCAALKEFNKIRDVERLEVAQKTIEYLGKERHAPICRVKLKCFPLSLMTLEIFHVTISLGNIWAAPKSVTRTLERQMRFVSEALKLESDKVLPLICSPRAVSCGSTLGLIAGVAGVITAYIGLDELDGEMPMLEKLLEFFA